MCFDDREAVSECQLKGNLPRSGSKKVARGETSGSITVTNYSRAEGALRKSVRAFSAPFNNHDRSRFSTSGYLLSAAAAA
jgi:hypothetical protein